MERTPDTSTGRLRAGASVAVAMGVMNLANYGYTIIAAHTIGKEPFGAFSALLGVLLVVNVVSLGLQATGARRISAEPDQAADVERVVLGVGLRSALVLGGICLVLAPVINAVLHLDSIVAALMVGFAAAPLTYMGAQLGVLQGERRWEQLALVYLAQGVGRVVFGLAFILVSPSELTAVAGVAVGAYLPVLIGWFVLRRPRERAADGAGHPGLELIREVGHSSQALLAFFALSNIDILMARATLSTSQAGIYAGGLILVKAVLFLPQFVVVIAFPSMSTKGASRRTLLLSLGVTMAMGAVSVVAVLVLPKLALVFVGGNDFAGVSDILWKFAVVGTLLSALQLLVYSALARRQVRAVVMTWTALVVLVLVALTASTAATLVLIVVAVDGVLFLALLVTALLQPAAAVVDEQSTADRAELTSS